ncbi:MAG: adenosylcobalamin-dependent ribonucleoside-diphosphate reductase [Anaerolineaceae bacterium]|nr:adenosylcobalamin-dependent ribonucleoside-diphosphate reductase [Anaerolineaceae bacterium]
MQPIDWKANFERYGAREPAALSQNALAVLRRRYLLKDASGQPTEEPGEMFRRVAGNVAEAEGRLGDDSLVEPACRAFLGLMMSLDFLPNSPTLMNAGRKLQQLAACFVLPVEDSIEGIFDAVKAAALIHQSGGGTGFSFSRLRPSGDLVSTSCGQASGPISFMRVFNEATRAISQGGFRRGANMAILRIDHPDIRAFIDCKTSEDAFENFNISVAVTEEFMRQLDDGGQVVLRNPRDGSQVDSLPARRLWDNIVHHAWANGEPGLFFVDRANADHPTPALGQIESTNPCGEQPLLPYEACNLGSINLSRFADGGDVDFPRLGEAVHLAVRLLDNAIEMSRYPLPQIDQVVKGNRKIGLGVMGWADLLIEMGVAYDSDQALEVADRVMGFIAAEARRASRDLARQRGPFPNHERSIFAGGPGQRNATVTTIAPTGTLSLIAGCSAGIEPIFNIAYERHVLGDQRLLEIQPGFERIARQRGFYSPELMARLPTESPDSLEEIPPDVRRLFVTAHDVSPEWHVRMQAAFQRHVDNAVSKTVNLPNQAGLETVDRIYRLAWELGCKGITIYRDATRRDQVLVHPNGRSMVCRECLIESEAEICPDCERQLVHESGCLVCRGCGYTRC